MTSGDELGGLVDGYVAGRIKLSELAYWLNEHLEEFADLRDDDPMAELWGFTQVRVYEHDGGALPEDVLHQELAAYLREQHLPSPKTQATG